jgi:isopentenyl diphosphate isomerase/L-lactate dehydrogenase-like FMN-dependent dehydrogenase
LRARPRAGCQDCASRIFHLYVRGDETFVDDHVSRAVANGYAAFCLLELLEDEVTRCLGLLGVGTFAELDASYLHPAEPVTSPHVLSAFPLLKIEDYRY